MSVSKGAREFSAPKFMELQGETLVVNLESTLLPVEAPDAVDKNRNPIFKVGDIIRVMPPDRYSKNGWEAKILELSPGFCKYRLLETQEVFMVSKLVLVHRATNSMRKDHI